MQVFNKLYIQFFELHLQKNRFLCLIIILVISFVVYVFELLSPVLSDSETSWTAAHQASLSFSISWSLLKLMSIESVMPSNHMSSPSPPVFNLSQYQGLFQRVSSLHQVAKVLELQLHHQSFQ